VKNEGAKEISHYTALKNKYRLENEVRKSRLDDKNPVIKMAELTKVEKVKKGEIMDNQRYID